MREGDIPGGVDCARLYGSRRETGFFFVSWHISTQAISANLRRWLTPFLNLAAMARRPFNLRLIPEFGGTASDETIIELLERVEMISEVADEERVASILLLRLTNEALAAHRQLNVKVTYLGIRSAHERVWLIGWKPIWLPRAYLTRGDLEPARGNLHVCKF